ncbi:MAG: sugar ABC transporter ATP-binding protein, partial [Candidatus Heimdallarchaeota archaeon]|nr:sugar ABC transporter ATP-binding protein [Candidatus Heimdallarchaeota archaeon]
DPHSSVSSLRVAEKQSIEIIRALSNKCKILVLDEPTSALSAREIQILFDRVNKLKDDGMSIIFISHKINEIKTLADRVTVLRDGEKIGTVSKKEIIKKDLIKMMIGRELKRQFPMKNKVNSDADPVLIVSNLTRKNAIKNISFILRKGEILGISGLVGSGRTELVRCIFGIDKIDSGTIEIYGKMIKVNSTIDALRNGIGLVPEERRYQGLIINRSVQENITYPIVDSRLCNFGFILKWGLLKNIAKNFKEKLDIKCVDLQQKASSLSGGNQQKIVVSKWLAARSKILILDEPTIGIDVGAKAEIYRLLNELTKQEVSIIIVSSELEEIIGLCNRAIIMREGMVVGELKEDELNSKNIGKLSFSEEE